MIPTLPEHEKRLEDDYAPLIADFETRMGWSMRDLRPYRGSMVLVDLMRPGEPAVMVFDGLAVEHGSLCVIVRTSEAKISQLVHFSRVRPTVPPLTAIGDDSLGDVHPSKHENDCPLSAPFLVGAKIRNPSAVCRCRRTGHCERCGKACGGFMKNEEILIGKLCQSCTETKL